MKYLFFILPVLVAASCVQPESKSDKTNGFGPYEGQSVYLGDQETVDAFKKLDKAWAARDYNAMKEMIADQGMFVFEDGFTANSAQEFVDKVESEYQENLESEQVWGWKTNYAFSVYPKGALDSSVTN